ncbi:hypothetical protein [Streptomyces triticirhizae]|uniref:GNAT family N-acetyltransferase n=1 Tax=Streptomyces triticirhizae TaxID=2483353 RepID=A0A3M2M3J0_9ACTN|nr:hypothetical protein [Streptomyces triticirhizae]RMI44131.1 hypothetical protein EBN88_05850 [Streptomyces triticirhizae]
MSVDVAVVRAADDELVGALARLLPQLSGKAGALDRDAVERVRAGEAVTVLTARWEGRVVAW